VSVPHRRIFTWSLVAALIQAALAVTIAAQPQLYAGVGVWGIAANAHQNVLQRIRSEG